jgi:hypothetical protein
LDDGSTQKATPDHEIESDVCAWVNAALVDAEGDELGAIPEQ